MSVNTASLHAPKPNPIRAVANEIGYRAYELKDKVQSWSRVFLKKLVSLKPISKNFEIVAVSEDGIAKEYKHKPSGLKIFNVNDTNSGLTNIYLSIPLPETPEKIPGSAHFFEHMAMTNEFDHLGKDIMTWAQENSVECYASTGHTEMKFIFNLPETKMKPIIQFLSKLFDKQAWNYDPKVVEGEREVIQSERQECENKPTWHLMAEIAKFFKGARHYVNKNLLGTKEDISKINTKEFEEVRAKFNSGESSLHISGPNARLMDTLIHDSFKDIAAQKKPTEKVEVDYEKEVDFKTTGKVFKHHDFSDSHNIVFYPNKEKLAELNLDDIDKSKITNILCSSLLIGEDTRLPKLFNKKKINAGFSFMGYNHENGGTVNLNTFFTDKKFFAQIKKHIIEEFQKISKEGLKLEELKTIKKMFEKYLEELKENPSKTYRSAISLAEELEVDNWKQFTGEASLKYLQNITKDETSFNAFNEKIKAFTDTYLVSGKHKTLETHYTGDKSNVGKLSSEDTLQNDEQKTENHYKRPIVEYEGQHALARMPWHKASMLKQDDKTFLVNDKESNLTRASIINPSGLGTYLDPEILASRDDDLIRRESYRQAKLSSFAMSIFRQTLGAKEELSPEKLDARFKELGTSARLSLMPKTINFNISGMKKNTLETLKIFSEVIADPAILSDEPKARARVEQKFKESMDRSIKYIEESKKNRDSILMRQFRNTLYKDDPERQALEPNEQLEILKGIKLDDLRNFFRRHIIFDDQMKVIMNNSSQEAGLTSSKLQEEVLKVNDNNTRKEKNPEMRALKTIDIPKKQELSMNSDLDKTSALFKIGNLTDDLSKLSSEDRKLLSMTMEVLTEHGLNSRLGGKLREAGVYFWGANFSLPDDSLGRILVPQKEFSVTCECKPEEVDKIRKVILDTINEFLEKGISQDEIEKIQNRLNLKSANSLRDVEGRMDFFMESLLKNKTPRKMLNLANRFYDVNRAKEIIKMVIKPDSFIEAVDIPKNAANNIVNFKRKEAVVA